MPALFHFFHRVFVFGERLRLPNSWFVLTLSAALALSTFWLQRYLATFPFWDVQSLRHIDFVIERAQIGEYRQGYWFAQSIAERIHMQSDQNASTPSVMPNEVWLMTQWQSFTRPMQTKEQADQETFYYWTSPQARYVKAQELYTFSPQFIALAFAPHSLNGETKSWESLAQSSMMTTQARFEAQQQRLILPEKVDLRLESNRLQGQSLQYDLRKHEIVLNQPQGWLNP